MNEITEPYALDAAFVDRFRRDGHIVLRGLAAPDDVAAYRPAIQRGAKTLRHEKRPLEERDTYGRAFLQSCNLWRVEPDVERFVRSPRFGGGARGGFPLLGRAHAAARTD